MNTQELNKMYNKLQKETGHEWLSENTCLLVQSGSVVYGANTASSDEDYKGVVFKSFECLTGLGEFKQANTVGRKTEKTKSNEVDLMLQSLESFTDGYAKGQFNELQLLMTNKEFVVKETELGKELREVYLNYTSKYAYHAFKGNVMNTLKVVKREYGSLGGLNYKAMYQGFNYVTLGQEYLREGYFETYTPSRAKMLQEVRQGYYTSYEGYLKALEEELKLLEECYQNSKLAEEYNREGLSKECTNLYKKYYGFRG